MTWVVPTVFHVDSDAATRREVEALCHTLGLPIEGHDTAAAFLSACDPERPGCLVLDLCLPDMEGLDLLAECARRKIFLPAVLVAHPAKVSLVVQAMKQGAVQVLEKPYLEQPLRDALHEALATDARRRSARVRHLPIGQVLTQLTPAEREVLGQVLAGRGYKEIAADLDVSIKTVEAHRTRIRKKLGCHDLNELLTRVLDFRSWCAALTPWERAHLVKGLSWLLDQ